MAHQVGPARGMRDFLPRDKRRRDRVLQTITKVYRQHGFDPMETPAVEDHSTLHSGLGGDNEKLSFGILRRGLQLEDVANISDLQELTDLGLRFDLTVPLARYVASHRHELPEVFRALHIGPVWRAERPQKGRFRQFVQCDIDIVGDHTTLAEREVLVATAGALQALGVTDYQFRVNDRRLLTAVLAAAGVAPDSHLSVLITLDKLDKIGAEGVLAELEATHAGGYDPGVMAAFVQRAGTSIALEVDAVADVMSAEKDVAASLVSWASEVADVIGSDHVLFDPSLVRGMGYYTGSIVELAHPASGSSLGGGGRYDQMVGRFLGDDVPAFGFSLGFERLVEVVEDGFESDTDRVAVVFSEDISPAELLRVKKELIDAGHEVGVVAAKKNMGSVYSSLESQGYRAVALLQPGQGAAELEWRELDKSR